MWYGIIYINQYNERGDPMTQENKNLRISGESYSLLKEIKYQTDEPFIDIAAQAIKEYHEKLKRQGKI